MKPLILTFLIAIWGLPAFAGAHSRMTDAERSIFRSEVRAYLLENPEVLMEAVAILQQRQNADQAKNDADLVAANSDDIYHDGYSYVGGNLKGDVTLVEFMDYRCTYCRRAHDELKKLVAGDGNIRFVVKEFPILGKQSTISSRLAIATLHQAGPKAYAKLGDFLIRFNGNLTSKTMTAILKRQGLNPDPILAYMDNAAVSGQIGAIKALSRKLQISGTPTFVLGGRMLRGYVPLDSMRALILSAREQLNPALSTAHN